MYVHIMQKRKSFKADKQNSNLKTPQTHKINLQ